MTCVRTVPVDPDLFVVDTSAVLRLYLDDGPAPEMLLSAFERAARGDALLLAPDLLWIESASVLLKQVARSLLTLVEASELLEDLGQLPIRGVPAHGLKLQALQLASAHGLSAYDALFLALTIDRQASLLTADHRLQRVAQRCGCLA